MGKRSVFEVKQQFVLQMLTLLPMSLTPRKSSVWHNVYDCVVRTLDHRMDPSSSHLFSLASCLDLQYVLGGLLSWFSRKYITGVKIIGTSAGVAVGHLATASVATISIFFPFLLFFSFLRRTLFS